MKRIVTGIIAFIGLLVFFSSFYVVKETEQVVITRFGRPVSGSIKEAGIHFKLPLIDKVNSFDRRILEWDGNVNQIPTKEKKYIQVDTTARWRIVDALKFLETVGIREDAAQTRLDDIIDSSVRNEVRSRNLIEIVRNSNRVLEILAKENTEITGGADDDTTNEAIKIGREQITRNILKKATPVIQKYGIELIDVRIKGLMYEQSVLDKVYTRMISERKRIAEELRSEGQAEKAKIEGKRNLELKKIQSEAYRKAQEIKGGADAESTKIYAEAFNLDPDFYQFLKSLETYDKALGKKSTLILGTNTEYLKVLKRGR